MKKAVEYLDKQMAGIYRKSVLEIKGDYLNLASVAQCVVRYPFRKKHRIMYGISLIFTSGDIT